MLKVFVIKGNDKIEVESELTVLYGETVNLSFNKSCHISGDEDTRIGNYGETAYFEIFATGQHKIRIKHGVHTKYLYVTVYQMVATMMNPKISQPIPIHP